MKKRVALGANLLKPGGKPPLRVGLIVFDRSTLTKTSPVLGIRTPHQLVPGTA